MMKRLLLITGLLGIVLSSGAQPGEDSYLKGVAWYRRGVLDSAAQALERSLEADEPRPERNKFLGEVYLKQNRPEKALRAFASSTELRTGAGLLGMARAYALQGEVSSALYHLEQYLNLKNKEPRSALLLYPEFRAIEDNPSWKQLWKKDHYSRQELALDELGFLIRKERWNEAGDLLRETEQIITGAPEEWILLKAQFLLHRGETQEAVSLLSRELIRNARQPELLTVRAAAYSKSEKYEKALEDLQAARRLQPEEFDLLLETGRVCLAAEKVAEGLSFVETYLIYFPHNREALMLAGDLCAGSGLNYQALVYYNRILEKDRDNLDAFIKRADVYASARSWSFAIKDYSMALDLDPENPLTWFHKAEAELAKGDTETACYDLRKAWRLGYRKAASLINEHCLGRSKDQNP